VINLLRYDDLKKSGLVGSRPTLGRWIKEQGFPPGRLLGAKTRVWTEEEINTWFASRSTKEDAGSENVVVSLDRVRTQLIDTINFEDVSLDVLASAEEIILELHNEISAARESATAPATALSTSSLLKNHNDKLEAL
jgi:predicted DNA-binding transcriptional regulator AlpA